jgi:hypothetical protein
MRKSLLLSIAVLGILLSAIGLVWAQTSTDDVSGVVRQDVGGPTPVTDQKFRYVIPSYNSQNTLAGSRSVTTVTVYNQTTKPCIVGMEFQAGQGTTSVCSMSLTIPVGQGNIFCSRSVNDPIGPCTATCSPELTFNQGHAYVSSNAACSNIVVDAQVVYTSDVDDNIVVGIRPLKLVKYNKANLGD